MEKILKAINSILHSWDPIGYTPGDEYNDLVLKIYKQLIEGKSGEQLVDFVEHYLIKVIGLTDISRSVITENVMRITNEYCKLYESK